MVPFPRSHFQLVGLPVERSVKFTSKGEHPESGVAEKFAAGCENTLLVHKSNKITLRSLFIKLVAKLLFIGYKDQGRMQKARINPLLKKIEICRIGYFRKI